MAYQRAARDRGACGGLQQQGGNAKLIDFSAQFCAFAVDWPSSHRLVLDCFAGAWIQVRVWKITARIELVLRQPSSSPKVFDVLSLKFSSFPMILVDLF